MKLRIQLILILAALCGFAQAQPFATVTWQKKTGPSGGEITDIEYDVASGKLFALAGSQRRLFISSDNGDTWVEKTNGNGDFSYFNDIEITNNTIYLITSYGFWTSTDGGANFTEVIDEQYTWGNGSQIRRLSTGRLIALTNNGIFYSTNGGTVWNTGYNSTGINGRWLIKTSADQLFIVKDQTVYKSSDGGANFSIFNTNIVGQQVHSIAVNNAGSTIYCVTGANIYESNGTAGWASIKGGSFAATTTLSDFSSSPSQLAFSKDGLGMYFIDNFNQKLHSKTVSGLPATWAERATAFPTNSVDVLCATVKDYPSSAHTTSTAFFGSALGVYKTGSGGLTYFESNSGIAGISPNDLFGDSNNRMFILTQNNELLRSTDGGNSWTKMTNYPGSSTYALTQNTARNVFYLSTSNGAPNAYRSTDGGGTWTSLASLATFAYGLYAADDNKVFAYHGNSFSYSSNQGTNWAAATISNLPASFSANTDDIFFASPTLMFLKLYDYGSSTNKFYKITMTYTGSALTSAVAAEITNSPITTSNAWEIFAANGKFYIINPYGNPDQLAVSSNGGTSWTTNSISPNANYIWAAYNGYIFATNSSNDQINISRDDGASFQTTTLSNADVNQVRDIEISSEGRAFMTFDADFTHATANPIVTPKAPSAASVIGNTANSVALRWTNNESNFNFDFNISQSTNGVDFTEVGEVFDFCNSPTSLGFYTASNLQPSTNYTFRINASNDAGSSSYTQVSFSTPASCATVLPPDNRSWQAVNSGESGFSIVTPKTVNIRSIGNGKYEVDDVTAGVFGSGESGIFALSCSQTTLVESDDGDVVNNGNGTWNSGTNTLTVKWRQCSADETETITFTLNTSDPAPSPPAAVRAYVVANNTIQISWQGGAYDKKYYIERSPNGTTGWTPLGSGVNYPTTTYSDVGAFTAGLTYYYRVKSENANVTPIQSAYSAVASVPFNNPKFLVANNAITNFVASTVGAYWGDFDNDGYDDYLTVSFNNDTQAGSPYIFRNNGAGGFTQLQPTLDGLPYFLANVSDYNNDGNLDITLQTQESSEIAIFKGNGDLTFTKVVSGLGDLGSLSGEGVEISTTSWGDINNDGLLDLFVTGEKSGGGPGNIIVYRQNVGNSFTKITAGQLGTDATAASGAFFADFNNDGFQDVAISNTNGACRLYENNGDETFTLKGSSGFDAASAFSIAWGDYNNDGFIDMFAGSFANNALYKNNGDETFTKDISTAVTEPSTTVGSAWGDFNNDGFLDLICSGFLTGQTRLFLRDAAQPNSIVFQKFINEKINDLSISHYGVAVSDFDRNGYVDIGISSFEFEDSGDEITATNTNFYVNNIQTGNWSQIVLAPTSTTQGNSEGIGAQIRLTTGGVTQSRQIMTTTSVVSRSSTTTHFGIGAASAITNIQVRWPNGQTQNYPNPPINQLLTVDYDLTAPGFSSRTPVNGATGVSTTTTLVLTLNEGSAAVPTKNLVVSTSGNPNVFTIPVTSAVKSGNQYTFTLPGALSPNVTYGVSVEAASFIDKYANGTAAIASTSWSFTTTSLPAVVTTVPANSASNVNANATLSITFDKPVVASATKGLKIYESPNTTTAAMTLLANTGVINGNTITFTLPSKLKRATAYEVGIEAGAFNDGSGNDLPARASSAWTFTTDSGPSQTTLVPANSLTSVAANTTFAVTFNRAVTAQADKFIRVYLSTNLITPVQTMLATAATMSGNTATFTFPSKLSRLTTYHVSLDAGAFADVNGNENAQITTSEWSFVTDQGPVVTTLSPVNNATGVALNTSLQIVFDRAVALGAGNIKVMDGANVVFDVSVANGTLSNNTFTYVPTANLPTDKLLKATVTQGAFIDAVKQTDFVGIVTDGWNFTTTLAPDITPPTISFDQTQVPSTLAKSFPTFTIGVTIADDRQVTGATLKHRKIGDRDFSSAPMTFNAGNNKWEVQVASTMANDMGVEYFFEASDNTNTGKLPLASNTYFKSNTSFPTAPSVSLPSSGTKDSWKIISVPYVFQGTGNSVSALFESLGSSDDGKNWRLITYQHANTWVENISTLARGKGYFINTKISGAAMQIAGASAPPETRDNLFQMTLTAGWNQIGNPYTVAINLNDVKNYNPSLANATFKIFSNGNYGDITANTMLGVHEGGFVNVPNNTTISIPFPGQTVSGGRKGLKDLGNDIDNSEWRVSMTLTQDNGFIATGSVGMADDANHELDSYDEITPPRFFDFVEMFTNHPQHVTGKFSADIVPSQEYHTWEFNVASNLIGVATLNWDNMALSNSSKELFLLDESRQILVNMKETGSYSFNPKESSKLRVYFGENLRIAPETITLGKAFPNPTSGLTSLAFSLPDSGGAQQSVTLDVIDAMGRSAGTVAQGYFAPGYHEVTFDARELSNGLYTYRISVQGQNGRTTKVNKLIIK